MKTEFDPKPSRRQPVFYNCRLARLSAKFGLFESTCGGSVERCLVAIAFALSGALPSATFADEGLSFDIRVVEVSCVSAELDISTCNDLAEVLRKLSGLYYDELARMASQHYRGIVVIPAGRTHQIEYEVFGGTMDIIINSTGPESDSVEVEFGYDINPTNGDSFGGSHQFPITLGGPRVAISAGVTTTTVDPDRPLQTTIRAFLLEAAFIRYQEDES